MTEPPRQVQDDRRQTQHAHATQGPETKLNPAVRASENVSSGHPGAPTRPNTRSNQGGQRPL